jgi:drug/metabolite transporter (DMT)-like permease
MVLGLSWLMLGEPIRWYHWVGAIGVIAGVLLTTRPPGRYPRPKAAG